MESATQENPTSLFQPWPKSETNQTLGQRFEKQVEKYPERIAVRSSTGELTYAQLNAAANRLAHALFALDSRLGQRIAVLLGQDIPLMSAIVGISKTGKICVVLSPAHPEDRLKNLMKNAGAEILITDAAHLAQAQVLAGGSARIINLEELDPALSEANPAQDFPPETLAFIIYTSGSTGQPKGVMQNHRNVLHNVRRHTMGLHFNSEDRIGLFSSCGTGQGLATAYCALLNGACLQPRDLAEASLAGLAEWIIEERITVIIFSASVFRHFMKTLTGRERFPDLRALRLASEPVKKNDLQIFQSYFEPDCVFSNTYSITETGNLCQFLWNQKTHLAGDVMPIGRAVEDMEILLLDDQGREVGVGEIGEMVVRSRYISPGYWNDPELSNKSFLSIPGSEERLFHTRDLARRDAQGLLEHLGRKDNLIKIRGFRVYPEEISTRLRQHPAVSDAIVDSRTDAVGNVRIIAYFIRVPQQAATPKELRNFLKELLPDYMVPSVYLEMEVFPRTPNGKVDRLALQNLPIKISNQIIDDTAKPTNAIEELLVGVWEDVLNLPTVGIHDNFFELGGDSLMVTQLLFRIKEVTGVDLPLHLLFEQATVAELSVCVQKYKESHQEIVMQPIVPVPRDQPVPLSFSQERVWRYSQTEAGNLGWLLSQGFALDGSLDRDALQRSLSEVVRRNASLRTTFAQDKDEPVQVIGPAGPVNLRFVDCSHAPDPEAEADLFWREEEARVPVQLRTGPILRTALLRLSEHKHWLLISYHHIVSDAWSRDNLLGELAMIYAAFSKGLNSPLPEPELQYADFAVWQRSWLRRDGKPYQSQLAYWKRQLADSPRPLTMPFKRKHPPATANLSESFQRWSISAETSQRLHAIGRREGATLFMTRLTAFAAHLHRLTGTEDVVISSYITNRNRRETQNMIGFFSNLIMLRVNLEGDPSFRELLIRVRTTTLEATAAADIPSEEIMTELRGEKIRVPELQFLFDLKYGNPATSFGDLKMLRMNRKIETIPWGFQLSVDNWGDQSQGSVQFDSNLYDPAGVAKAIADFESLLAEVAAEPERRLSQLR